MHVIVVGGGIAGLGAAHELCKGGASVTLLEASDVLGGRCRSVNWHGEWLITGAMAFSEHDTNLVELADELGIRDPAGLVDLTAAHHQRIRHGDRIIDVEGFTVGGLLGVSGIPAKEKVALARLLPAIRRLNSGTAEQRSHALRELDTIDACTYIRGFAPFFVDYIIEPTMQMFCGYEAGDYSLGWLLQSLGPLKLRSGRKELSWWSWTERGVGALSHSLAESLGNDQACEIRTQTAVTSVSVDDDHATVAMDEGSLSADAVIVAVPGNRSSALVHGIDDDQRVFLDQIQYRGHHIAYFNVEGPISAPPGSVTTQRETVGLLLPTVEGFAAVSNLSVRHRGGGALVYAEMKGGTCARLSGESAATVLDTAWSEIAGLLPGLEPSQVTDRLLSRNEAGLCTYPTGYVAARQRFLDAPQPLRLSWAGDWMANCSVGAAHRTGVRAAQRTLEACLR
jgi:oxygen-dependent protoporphyrinogen oxidase